METKITKHYFQYETNKYFRGNAHNVDIGSYGPKKDPVGAKSYLDVQNRVKSEHLADRVRYGNRVKIDWSRTTEAEVEAEGALKFFGLNGKAALSASYEKAKSAKLELINFVIDGGPLQTMLNRDADGARKYLADEGNDGRIVSEVWVVVDGDLSEHFATSGSISAAGNGADSSVEIIAKGGVHGAQTIRLEKGTTFAYKLHKVKDWNKGKTVVEKVEADWKGLD